MRDQCHFNKGKKPKIIAHRGASGDAPENTLAAFELAWDQSADGIEADFRLSGDGQIVCIHDEKLGRTTKNAIELDVSNSTMKELREIDVGSWRGAEFAGEKVPAFEEVLDILKPGKVLFMEIKSDPEILETMKRIINGSKSVCREQLVIISFKKDVILQARKILPEIRAQLLVRLKEKTPQTLDFVLDSLQSVNADGVDIHANPEIVDEDFVLGLRKAGYEFHTWTINEKKLARRFNDLGVDSITTDCPALMHKAI